MAIHRILVLGVTFLAVGLCPGIQPALAVFAVGIAVFYFFGYMKGSQ